MGLTYLTNGEMVETTSRWVGSERATFLGIPEIAGLMPAVEAAHQGLLGVVKAEPETYPTYNNNEVLDGRQDHLLRALYYIHRAYREFLQGQVQLDVNAIQRVKDSQKALLPHGLTGTRVSYVEEAGNAKLAQEAYAKTPAASHVLGEVRLTATVTGKQVMEQWLAAAAALGAAAQEKTASKPVADPQLPVKILKARQAWISIVRTVLAVLEHTTAASDKVAALRKPVDDLETKATMRAMQRQKAEQPAPAGPAAPTG